MIKHVFYLSTCSTCTRILKEIQLDKSYTLQDIKKEKISIDQLEKMKELAGSYSALFSKTAMKYKSLGLKNKDLSEEEIKHLILEEYTFLKRPVFIIGDAIFIGNSKANIEQVNLSIK